MQEYVRTEASMKYQPTNLPPIRRVMNENENVVKQNSSNFCVIKVTEKARVIR